MASKQQRAVVLPVRALDGRTTTVRLPAAASVRDLKAALRASFPPAQAAPAFHLFLHGAKLILDDQLATISLARGEFVSLISFTSRPAPPQSTPAPSAAPHHPPSAFASAKKRKIFQPSWHGEDVYARIAKVPNKNPASPSFYCHGEQPLGPAQMVEHLKQGLGKHGQIRHVQEIPGQQARRSLDLHVQRQVPTAAEKTEHPVPIAKLRQLARAGRLAGIDATVTPLLPSHSVGALSALSSVGLPDRASTLLGTIASPTAAHLNAVLGPLLRRRRLAALVQSILEAHASVPRDASTDSILAKSLCLTSGADSALHLLREPSSGAPPSLHLFTALIDSFYKQRLPHRAQELWRAMVQDHGIAPDTAAYNARITYKAANGTVEEVKELIRVMREEAGLQPDVASYNALMPAMAQHKRVDEAVEVYRGVEAGEVADVAPDCVTYTCVVGALCGVGRWSEVEDVFYEGVKRRKVANLGTVRGLKGAGKGRAARRVVVGLHMKFPERFDGSWKEQLKEAAGLPASGEEDDDREDRTDEQPATVMASA